MKSIILSSALTCLFLLAQDSQAQLKIMALGDSITEGTEQALGSYRTDLVPAILHVNSNILFVGSKEQGPLTLVQRHHEGHSGWRIDNLIFGRTWGQSFEQGISLWLPLTQPHLILLMIGTNDILQNYDLPKAMQRYGQLLDQIKILSPSSTVLISSVIPTNNDDLNRKINIFNRDLQTLVLKLIQEGRSVKWVDMNKEAGINWTLGDLIDGVHPTSQGYSKIAKVWFLHLRSFL